MILFKLDTSEVKYKNLTVKTLLAFGIDSFTCNVCFVFYQFDSSFYQTFIYCFLPTFGLVLKIGIFFDLGFFVTCCLIMLFKGILIRQSSIPIAYNFLCSYLD